MTSQSFTMVAIGAFCGVGLGLSVAHYADMLLYQVKATDTDMLVETLLTMLLIAAIAAIRPVMRAVRIEPMAALRIE